ncbi:MAG: hypothetical protein ABJR46_13510 [Tateyamaria sp.]|uniref:hypothetical protein n=1 Tax=Tateyamaria sp. TaxID=1929288 RepID=UPI00329BF2E7
MKIVLLLACLLFPLAALAQDRDFSVSAPAALVDTGVLRHILPRFSLKHGVRITLVEDDGDVQFGAVGTPVFSGLDTLWHISHSDAAGPELFINWLLSDIGRRTINGFKVDDTALFSTDIAVKVVVAKPTFDGDPVAGERLALLHCGRCHVINDSNRMKGMGQTPSFALMRTFEDWQNRFATFYVLNPHPSFTQVKDITPPFSANLPPAIVPVEITQNELEAILAYVATIPPADLGAPLQNQ